MTRKLTDYETDIVEYLQTISGFQTTRDIFKGIHLFEGDRNDLDRLSKSLWHLCKDDGILQSQPIPNDRHNRKRYRIMTEDNLLNSLDDPEFREDLPEPVGDKGNIELTLTVLRAAINDLEGFVKIDDLDYKIDILRIIAGHLNVTNSNFLNDLSDELERFR
jgi:hypothetical protein